MSNSLGSLVAVAMLLCASAASAQPVDHMKAQALIAAGILISPFEARNAVLDQCGWVDISNIQIRQNPYWQYVVTLTNQTQLRVNAETGQVQGQCPN